MKKTFKIDNVQYTLIQKTKEDVKTLFLQAPDLLSLEHLAKALIEFTVKIDPSLNPAMEIQKKTNEKETHYSLDLGRILPKHIAVLFGQERVSSNQGNCHGSALFLSGIVPVLLNFSNSPEHAALTNLIPVKDTTLKSGDLLTFSRPDDHSFIYLNPQWCISMNGQGQNIEICGLKNMLELYLEKKDFISEDKDSEQQNIQALLLSFKRHRNDYSISFSSDLLEKIARLYTIVNNHVYNLPSDALYPEVKEIYAFIKKHTTQQTQNPAYWNLVLQKVQGMMPCSIIDLVEKENPSIPNTSPVLAVKKQETQKASGKKQVLITYSF